MMDEERENVGFQVMFFVNGQGHGKRKGECGFIDYP
jgi:hypothetical protein